LHVGRMPWPATLPGTVGHLIVQVAILVNPDGTVTNPWIWRSSGYPDADAAAIKSALATTYSPKVVDCKAVAGRYLFRADFQSPTSSDESR
jgi:TonB family protein